MCGFSFYFSESKCYAGQLQYSIKNIRHRGPDNNAIKISDSRSSCQWGIGHSRLSIIDVSSRSNQPMTSKCGLVHLVFNGEIYNFKILRSELELRGAKFATDSDTEVILQLYALEGCEGFRRLRGMFSFCIVDDDLGKSYIVRDLVGVKPLYLYLCEKGVFGSSEIKGLLPFDGSILKVDPQNVYEFFNNGFLYEPDTGFCSIKKLKPGHMLTVDLASMSVSESPYITFDDIDCDQIGDEVRSSVQEQLVSDVPLGVFFSGGIDSSVLAYCSGDSKLLFAEYDDADVRGGGHVSDEVYAEEICNALGGDMDRILMSDSNMSFVDRVDFVAQNTEELISDMTFISTFQLSTAARERGIKVALSGMGGDEAFLGYPRYFVLRHILLFRLLSFLVQMFAFIGISFSSLSKKRDRLKSYFEESDFSLAYGRMLGYFSGDELANIFKDNTLYKAILCMKLKGIYGFLSKGRKLPCVKMAQYLDVWGFLAHNLTIADKASMLAGIELRVPLLSESSLVSGLRAPAKILMKRFSGKVPLKQILFQVLPKRLVNRPKTGFNPPLDEDIRKLGPVIIKERICESLSLQGMGELMSDRSFIDMVDAHFEGRANNTYKIWQTLYFCAWIKWVDGISPRS